MKRPLLRTTGIAAAIIACGTATTVRGFETTTESPATDRKAGDSAGTAPDDLARGNARSAPGETPSVGVLPADTPVAPDVPEPTDRPGGSAFAQESNTPGTLPLTTDANASPFAGFARSWDPVLTSGPSAISLPIAPSGFWRPQYALPWSTPGSTAIPMGFQATGSITGLYNSNINPGGGGTERRSKDDLMLTAGGTLSWHSRPQVLSFSAVYRGSYNAYLNNPEMSGYDQGLGLSANYDGAKLSATATVNLSSDEGINRYYSSEMVRQNNLVSRLVLRYDITPKTSLSADAGYRLATVDASDYDDTQAFDLGIGAKWKYSPITTLGAGIRYARNSGDSTRSSLGPELMVDYQLSSKVAINSRLGLEFPRIDGDGSENPSMTGSLALSYTPSELWAMNLMFYSGTQANASGGFTQVNALRLGYLRHIGPANFNLGLSYEVDESDGTESTVSSDTRDATGIGLDASVSMPVFSGGTYGTIFARYNQENGGRGGDWDGFQIGLSLQHTF